MQVQSSSSTSTTTTAPRRVRATPAEQMGFWLARSRRHGVPFDTAWAGAMRNIRWPHDKKHSDDWRVVMEWAREKYRVAYEYEPGTDESMRHLRSGNPVEEPVMVGRAAA